jgi:AraC family transcriptional regulator
MQATSDTWNVSPRPPDYRFFAWDRGAFNAARRDFTEVVEGTICSPHHLVMATLRGGSRRHQIRTACGHRADASDRAGYVSFLPARCERRLRLDGVAWEWASLALKPELFERDDCRMGLSSVATFSNMQDPFVVALLGELARLHAADGALDLTYCDAMSVALVEYLIRRYGSGGSLPRPAKLPAWRLRRISEYVDAHLDQDLRIPALASLVDLSEGHLSRSFRLTTGRTPVQFVNERRVHRALELLARDPAPIPVVALRVGFTSPSHFARIFRAITGVAPSQYRKELERRGPSSPAPSAS